MDDLQYKFSSWLMGVLAQAHFIGDETGRR